MGKELRKPILPLQFLVHYKHQCDITDIILQELNFEKVISVFDYPMVNLNIN